MADQTPTTRWRGRDFAVVMIAGLIIGSAIYAGGFALGWSNEFLLVGSAIAQYAGHLVALVAVSGRRGGGASLGFAVAPADILYVGLGVILQVTLPLLFLPLANLVGEGEAGQVVTDQIRQLGGTGGRLAMALVVGVIAPVTEEVMFRGVLLKALEGFGRRVALFASAAVFAGFHLFGLSGDFLRGVVLIFPTFLLMGLVLGWVTWRSKRLGPAIFIHSGFNLLALLVLLMPPDLIDRIINAQ